MIMQCVSVSYSVLQCVITPIATRQQQSLLAGLTRIWKWLTVTHWNALQHTAQVNLLLHLIDDDSGCGHDTTMQHTATHCSKSTCYWIWQIMRVLMEVTTHLPHYNTLQHPATHCNTLQSAATHYYSELDTEFTRLWEWLWRWQHTATHCNTR